MYYKVKFAFKALWVLFLVFLWFYSSPIFTLVVVLWIMEKMAIAYYRED